MPSSCISGIHFSASDGQALLGVLSQFKVNTCLSISGKRHRNPILHLVKSKPCIIEIIAPFQSIYSGVHFPASGFNYVHSTQVFSFLNLTAVSGLLPDPSDSAAIPIQPLGQVDRDMVFSSFVQSVVPITGF